MAGRAVTAGVAVIAFALALSSCSAGSKPPVSASTPVVSPSPSAVLQDFVDTEVPQPPADYGWQVKEDRAGVFSGELSPGFKMDADKLLAFYKDSLPQNGWTLRDEGGPKGYDLGSQKWSNSTTDISVSVFMLPGGTMCSSSWPFAHQPIRPATVASRRARKRLGREEV